MKASWNSRQVPFLADRYLCEEYLGGAMADVYRARDSELPRDVAIKILKPGVETDPEMRKSFIEEVQLASSCTHENIVMTYDKGEFNGSPFIVMEFLRGETLDKRIRTRDLDIQESLEVAVQISRAMEYIHSKGIIHRDLKPQNLNVDINGRVRLVDFGIAKKIDWNNTQAGWTKGTAFYMSPEQVRGEQVTIQTDIWSFGVLMFEMLSEGQRPFNDSTMESLWAKILNSNPDYNLLSSVPKPVISLVKQCLEKQPNRRYQSFTSIRATLEDLRRDFGEQTIVYKIYRRRDSGLSRFLKQAGKLGKSLLGIVDQSSTEPRSSVESPTRGHVNTTPSFISVGANRQPRLDPSSENRPASQPQVSTSLNALTGLRTKADPDPAFSLPDSHTKPIDSGQDVKTTPSSPILPASMSGGQGTSSHFKQEPKQSVDDRTERLADDKPGFKSQSLPEPAEFTKRFIAAQGRVSSGPLNQATKLTPLVPLSAAMGASIGAASDAISMEPVSPDLATAIQKSNRDTVAPPQSPTQFTNTETIGANSKQTDEEPESARLQTNIMPGLSSAVLRSDRGPVPPPLVPHSKHEGIKPPVGLTFTVSNDAGLVGRFFPVDKTPFRIGRAIDCDLTILSDSNISREQCVIEWRDGAYHLSDHGSRNGTWLSGRLLKGSAVLFSGAVIRFSSSTALAFVFNQASELPDLTGCLIEGRYRLRELLRSGSMSALYRAEDTSLNRQIAIKLLSPVVESYPGYLEKFTREAKMAAQLSHPHIAKVLDSGTTTLNTNDGEDLKVRYVFMEYKDGGSLAARITNGRPQTPLEVAAWLGPVSAALDYSHRNGIVHCGLKASSLVFDNEGKPYITDFAIATYSHDGSSCSFLGATDYTAPEQWDGTLPTPATDQYSLAMLAYYALTGVCPYEGQQDPEKRKRNFAKGAAPAHQEAALRSIADFPESLSAVIGRGMAVKPEERFPDISNFAFSFNDALRMSSDSRPTRPEIFLSYRRDVGTAWATLLSRELQRFEISVFVDTQRRDNVTKFPTWIAKAIQDCDIFVCLLSPTTLESDWVRQEIRLAFENEKPMIPILSEDFEHPIPGISAEPWIETLLNYQGVPLLDRKGIYLDAAVNELVRMIRSNHKFKAAQA